MKAIYKVPTHEILQSAAVAAAQHDVALEFYLESMRHNKKRFSGEQISGRVLRSALRRGSPVAFRYLTVHSVPSDWNLESKMVKALISGVQMVPLAELKSFMSAGGQGIPQQRRAKLREPYKEMLRLAQARLSGKAGACVLLMGKTP